MTAFVAGDCKPSGTVAFYVSGRLMSRQVLKDGVAQANITLNTATARPTFRTDYSGNESCAPSRDSVRRTVR